MNQDLLSFASWEDVNAAIEALVASGLPREALVLRVLEDEAGPTSGNFLIGNGQTLHGGPPGPVRTGPEVPYDENFRNPASCGAYLLVLSGFGEEQRTRARAVLASFDAVAPQEAAAAAKARA